MKDSNASLLIMINTYIGYFVINESEKTLVRMTQNNGYKPTLEKYVIVFGET